MNISINIIQTLGINNSNRDDLGNIKTVIFGGTVRQRVSSQCWKKKIREEMHKLLNGKTYRSALLADRLYKELVSGGMISSDALVAIGKIFAKGSDNGKLIKGYKELLKKGVFEKIETECLIFYSEDEYQLLLNACRSGESSEDIGVILSSGQKRFGGIIAMFGRMMADHPSLNIEAASSFAHAFSTHEIAQESDYFTAMDDCSTDQGACHLNQTSFTQSTVYRHIVLDVDQLKSNLPDISKVELQELASAFVEAVVVAFPDGKDNSFYARTLPDFVQVDVTNLPISMCGAFEKPVSCKEEGGYLENSITAFENHHKEMIEKGYEVTSTYCGDNYNIGELKEFIKTNV